MFSDQRPSICIVVSGNSPPSFANQTLRDYQVLRNVDEPTALRQSEADCFLWLSGAAPLRPQAAEECVWALENAEWVTWRDTGEAPPPSLRHCAGPLGVTRRTLETPEPQRSGAVRRLPWACRLTKAQTTSPQRTSPGAAPAGELLVREPHGRPLSEERSPATPSGRLIAWLGQAALHLRNAGLLSQSCWAKDPLGTTARLIPLSVKQSINDWADRPLFDLGFYLQFRPGSALIDGKIVARLGYETPPAAAGSTRVCFCTGHVRTSSARVALFELARQLDRETHQVFLVTTGEADTAFRREWLDVVDYLYDERELAGPAGIDAFLYSFLLNWDIDLLVIQDEPRAYPVLQAVKDRHPRLRAVDFVPSADHDWGAFSLSLEVDEHLDWRIAASTGEQERLREMAVEESKIRVIPQGVDLSGIPRDKAAADALRRKLRLSPATHIVVYAGTFRNSSQVTLLAEVTEQLEGLRPKVDFHILAAAAGPERKRLQTGLGRPELEKRISLLDHPGDLPKFLAVASLFVVPSPQAGLPLEALEALAAQTPIVACRSGPFEDSIPSSCGVLIEGGLLVESRLAGAIHSLLTDGARLQEMGRAGRRLVERRHSLEQTRQKYQRLIAEWNTK